MDRGHANRFERENHRQMVDSRHRQIVCCQHSSFTPLHCSPDPEHCQSYFAAKSVQLPIPTMRHRLLLLRRNLLPLSVTMLNLFRWNKLRDLCRLWPNTSIQLQLPLSALRQSEVQLCRHSVSGELWVIHPDFEGMRIAGLLLVGPVCEQQQSEIRTEPDHSERRAGVRSQLLLRRDASADLPAVLLKQDLLDQFRQPTVDRLHHIPKQYLFVRAAPRPDAHWMRVQQRLVVHQLHMQFPARLLHRHHGAD